MRRLVAWLLPLFGLLSSAAQAQPQNCNQPASTSSLTVSLPSSPFGVAPTADGCLVYVALAGDSHGRNGGIAVIKRNRGHVGMLRFIPLKARLQGIALTHDGKLLIAAAFFDSTILFLDTQRMACGAPDPIVGKLSEGEGAGSVYVNVTQDDRLLFVSDERGKSITVVDLQRARANGYQPDAIIGKIPVGLSPIALTFSPDGKWLYTTTQRALDNWNWPKVCKPEVRTTANSASLFPEGAVIVIDVERAGRDPEHSIVTRVRSGCNPVRLAISPGGESLYVTARGIDSVLAFDTETLRKDPDHARIGTAPTGTAPVPVAVIDHGKKVVVGSSDRFGDSRQGTNLVVFDAAKLSSGPAALLGTIPAGKFPREMAVSSDGRALFLTNSGSNSLQVIDLEHLPLTPVRQP